VHLDETADRQPPYPPPRSQPVRPAEQLPAKPDREGIDLHAATAGDPEMPELVYEHQDRQHHHERQTVMIKLVDKTVQKPDDHCHRSSL
jgi:hypothetical protein